MSISNVVILAGGRSLRMGADKAVVRVGGVGMLERVVREVAGKFGRVVVVGRGGVEGWPGDLGTVEFLRDEGENFGGPVAGVITGLDFLKEGVVVLGCDMPLVTAGLVRELVAAHEAAGDGRVVTMAVTLDEAGRERGEPMLAVYEMAVLPVLREMMAAGRRSLQSLLGRPGVAGGGVPAESVGELLNVNDGDEWRRAEEVLRGRNT